MVIFNDPLALPGRAASARCAWRSRCAAAWRELAEGWSRRGYDLDFGVGIAQGHATLGRIGFEGRSDYTAIGSVTNLAARLCAEAARRQILDQPARLRGDRGHRGGRLGRRAGAARLLAPGARLQRRRARRGAGAGMTDLAETAPRLSDLSERERSAAVRPAPAAARPALGGACGSTSPASRSSSSRRSRPTRRRRGTAVQALEERMLFLLLLLRKPRMRVIYVTGRPVPESVVDYYLGAAPRRHPAAGARAACTWSPRTTARPARWRRSCSSARACSPRSAR